ncbi:acetyltransferase [Listeria newyorkensis]|uniref:Acetyltransferase n=1 Tax=Listeria newyorkensis TaxID=1497681 RepID=A0ABX4XKV4_9LIST|nr:MULTISPECIES: DapH/DapD/GlmU-related protein [Listeria]KGL42433.1 acetyltransferase [Listeriaceae bacterium FSL A5-0209]KGL45557.1 acetyltransferase [Listeria newyorkensis]KMT62416.1 acetyltransferase [Listeria newyorkensis]PNP89400.1 acetyltransferase [Listeria newyorkensis]RQW66633.1 sugar O-acetyltransferase [Listeria sp. SHR_NRA_18]
MAVTLREQINGKEIKISDPVFDEIHRLQAENDERLVDLNTKFHSKQETNQILSAIIGENIDNTVNVMLPFHTDFGKHITLGKHVFINRNAMFVDLGGITLDDYVLIGPRVNLITVNHLIEPSNRRGLSTKPIHIKKNAWIGAAATVLPGVTIGENSIIAAGSIVTKDVPDNVIVVGAPAKITKKIH